VEETRLGRILERQGICYVLSQCLSARHLVELRLDGWLGHVSSHHLLDVRCLSEMDVTLREVELNAQEIVQGAFIFDVPSLEGLGEFVVERVLVSVRVGAALVVHVTSYG